jgi:H+-translocating NAD(P) transhydrogenase subunit alpha
MIAMDAHLPRDGRWQRRSLFPDSMRISVLTERADGEQRVALVPENVGRLVKAGATIVVQRGAGSRAFYADDAYVAAGATLADDAASAVAGADVVAKVQRPLADELPLLAEGVTLICLLQAQSAGDLIQQLAARRVSTLALERVPRITRAQSMDVLSSQATVAGYKAVLLGAAALPRLLPMMTTAAGSLTPGKAFVIGAGVAGLQAIATARRLGAVVSAFDVRPAAREQVQSLGATFVQSDVVSAAAEDKGGYAKAQSQDEAARTLETIGAHIVSQDLVITTAAIPGRAAPTLITAAMVQGMKPGAVIVDLAAETGGNCELTVYGETIVANGVTIIGPRNLPATQPLHASQMFGRNVLTLLQHLTAKEGGGLVVDPADEITGAMLVTHDGQIRLT